MRWAAFLKACANELTATQCEVNAVWLGDRRTPQLVHMDAFRAFSLSPDNGFGR